MKSIGWKSFSPFSFFSSVRNTTTNKYAADVKSAPPATPPRAAPFTHRGCEDGGLATSRGGDARPRRRRVRRRGRLDVLLVEIFLGNTQKLGARDCSRRHRRAGVRGRRRDRRLGIGSWVFRGDAGRVAGDVGPVRLGQDVRSHARRVRLGVDSCVHARARLSRRGGRRATRRQGHHHHGRLPFLRGLLLVPHGEAPGGGAPRGEDPAHRPDLQLARARLGGGAIAWKRGGDGGPGGARARARGPRHLPDGVLLGEPALGADHRGAHDVLQHLELVQTRQTGVSPPRHRPRALQAADGVRPQRDDVFVEPVRDDPGVLQRRPVAHSPRRGV